MWGLMVIVLLRFPVFLLLSGKNESNGSYFLRLREFTELMHVKFLRWCESHSKPSVNISCTLYCEVGSLRGRNLCKLRLLDSSRVRGLTFTHINWSTVCLCLFRQEWTGSYLQVSALCSSCYKCTFTLMSAVSKQREEASWDLGWYLEVAVSLKDQDKMSPMSLIPRLNIEDFQKQSCWNRILIVVGDKTGN